MNAGLGKSTMLCTSRGHEVRRGKILGYSSSLVSPGFCGQAARDRHEAKLPGMSFQEHQSCFGRGPGRRGSSRNRMRQGRPGRQELPPVATLLNSALKS